MSEQWISASEALRRIEASSSTGASRAICRRARDGMVLAKAQLLIWGRERREDTDIPAEFWWAQGESALEQNWLAGDFSTWINSSIECRAFGVTFRASDIDAMVPRTDVSAEPNGKQGSENRGRRRDPVKWANWTAELVAYIHENGIQEGCDADGQDQLIDAIDSRLMERGEDGLGRSTVQPIVRAVLLRLRSAGN